MKEKTVVPPSHGFTTMARVAYVVILVIGRVQFLLREGT